MIECSMDEDNWSPANDALLSILEVLRDSLIPDSEIQKRVQEKIVFMQNFPDFVNYLLYILGKSDLFEEHIRALSGIILKNNVSSTYDKMSQHAVHLMRHECLRLLKDSSREVRTSITTLIGALVIKGDIASWPDLLPHLSNLLDSPDDQLSETALSALFKICEEYLMKRNNDVQEINDLMSMLFLKFIKLVTSTRLSVRKDSIKLLNQVMQDIHKLQNGNFDSTIYLESLFLVANDSDTDVQKLICQAFVIFIDNKDTAILPHMHNVVEYLLLKSASEDGEIALQASEFWLALSKLPTCRDLLISYIDRLLPVLLKNMKYSNYELTALKDYVNTDEHVEDKTSDIHPNSGHVSGNSDDTDSFDGENYDQADAIGEPYVGWTLRKCSAASLDGLALKFQDELLPSFISLLNQTLNNKDLLTKESGILALGAIGDGCLNGLRQFLPDLINFLCGCLNDSQSIIRVITCWTLSRYMVWILEQPDETFFLPVMTALLERFLDSNKRVQRAALSAFCILQEEARYKILPYIELILKAFVSGFDKYRYRSFLLLYDAVGVLAAVAGNHLNKPEFIDLLLPPLMIKFRNIDYYDEQFLALMECLSNVAIAIETGILPYTEIIYNRCLVIINETVSASQYHAEKPEECEPPDKEPMCIAHDMLVGLATGLKTFFVKFVTNSNLVQQMYYTMQDDFVHVRQPALALYGELIKLCFEHLYPTVYDYIPIVIENLDKRFDGACNNAAWVIGKLCIGMGTNIEPFIPEILRHFLEIMETCVGTKTMYQTVSISLCTVALVCPDLVVPHIPLILRPCCQAMRNVRDCDEKEFGFRGLCELVMRNPNVAINEFIYYCDAVASWNEPNPELRDVIKNILNCFREHFISNNWISYFDQFPPLLKIRLNKLYGI